VTYCADYDPISCPVGCYYAEETEKLNRELSSDLRDYVIMSIIYGTELCELTRKNNILKGDYNYDRQRI